MITKIEISGYKSIKSLVMDLKPINILLGGNGAGKSNFVSVFSLIRNIYNKNLQNYIQKKGGADNFLYFGSKNTSNIYLGLTFEELRKGLGLSIPNFSKKCNINKYTYYNYKRK